MANPFQQAAGPRQGDLRRPDRRPVHAQHLLARQARRALRQPGAGGRGRPDRAEPRRRHPGPALGPGPGHRAGTARARPGRPGDRRLRRPAEPDRLPRHGRHGPVGAAIEKQKRNEFHEIELLVRWSPGSSRTSSRPGSSRAGTSPTTCRSRTTGSATCTSTSPAASNCWPRATGSTPRWTAIQRRPQGRLPGHPLPDRVLLPEQVRRLRQGEHPAVADPAVVHPAGRPPAQRDAAGGRPVDPARSASSAARTRSSSAGCGPSSTAARPEDVVEFLRDNERVPSLYKNAEELADRREPVPGPAAAVPGGAGRRVRTAKPAAQAGRWTTRSTRSTPPGPGTRTR